jgi:hypothetical protein
VQSGNGAGFGPLELVPEEFGEKRVVAVPVPLGVKRDEQQVRALELIQDTVGSLCLGDGVAKRPHTLVRIDVRSRNVCSSGTWRARTSPVR